MQYVHSHHITSNPLSWPAYVWTILVVVGLISGHQVESAILQGVLLPSMLLWSPLLQGQEYRDKVTSPLNDHCISHLMLVVHLLCIPLVTISGNLDSCTNIAHKPTCLIGTLQFLWDIFTCPTTWPFQWAQCISGRLLSTSKSWIQLQPSTPARCV